jgi:hypothetical protein
MTDPKIAYERLRGETAKMLGIDPSESLSLIQNLQIDLLALLRLSVADLQGSALAGENVDLDKLSDSLAMLQKLLPESSLMAQPPSEQEELTASEASAVLREMEKMLDCYAEARRREMAENPAAAREQFEAELQAAIKQFSPGEAKPSALLAAPSADEAAPTSTAPKATKAAPAPAPSEQQEPSTTQKYYDWAASGGYSGWPGSGVREW